MCSAARGRPRDKQRKCAIRPTRQLLNNTEMKRQGESTLACTHGAYMPRLSHHDLRRNFRDLLNADRCFHTASLFDPLSARIAPNLCFEVGILIRSVASLQALAPPDFNPLTLLDFANRTPRLSPIAPLQVHAHDPA